MAFTFSINLICANTENAEFIRLSDGTDYLALGRNSNKFMFINNDGTEELTELFMYDDKLYNIVISIDDDSNILITANGNIVKTLVTPAIHDLTAFDIGGENMEGLAESVIIFSGYKTISEHISLYQSLCN